MPSPTPPMTVRFSDETRSNIERMAKITKRSRSYIINEAVEIYLRERIQYLEELQEAIEDAEGGYGHSSEQITKWMRSWGSENELPTPEPDITPQS